uniref:Multiple epidermal growth factor-like domains 10 n=1 Tax=Magallana gigas TaxID=29159 RepID=A0A8W8NWE5_MAGGI
MTLHSVFIFTVNVALNKPVYIQYPLKSDLTDAMEVYGCPGGFYGANCSNACPDTNCYCHLETGTCQGCKPGYQGYLCKSACGRGYYGVECQQECGHCHDLTKCFHTNGSCLTGCEAGYHGEACKASCQYGFFGPDCLHECNDTCDGCNRFNGSCDSGCNPGWQGYECQYACNTGSFVLRKNPSFQHFLQTPPESRCRLQASQLLKAGPAEKCVLLREVHEAQSSGIVEWP